jgi:hypothetical protein
MGIYFEELPILSQCAFAQVSPQPQRSAWRRGGLKQLCELFIFISFIMISV